MTGSKRAANRGWVLHPFLFAIWPILQLWASNADEAHASDAFLTGGLVLAGVAVLYLLARLLVRDAARAGLLVGLAVVVFFCYAAIHDLLNELNSMLGWEFLAGMVLPVRHRYAFALVGAVTAALALWILRTRRSLVPVTRLANLVAGLLVGFLVVQIGLRTFELARGELDGPQAIAAGDRRAERPDIYYIVLDRYGSAATLQEAYGHDNTGFCEDLEQRGFVVRGLRANYAKTSLAVSSCLQMEYHPNGIRLGNIIWRMTDGHAVGRFLKQRGYRYDHLGSWATPNASCRIADSNPRPPRSGRLSEFQGALLKMTPLRVLHTRFETEVQRDTAQFQFAELARPKGTPGPRFVVAHILLPHPPFVFDRDGNPVSRPSVYDERSKRLYLEQLRYTNTRVTQLVDVILAQSARPPVIVIQGDEGPFLRGDDASRSLVAQRRIRTGILSAILLPGETPPALRSMRTPINTFRILFNALFATGLPLLEERVWSWHGLLRPVEPPLKGVFEFTDISAEMLDTEVQQGRGLSRLAR